MQGISNQELKMTLRCWCTASHQCKSIVRSPVKQLPIQSCMQHKNSKDYGVECLVGGHTLNAGLRFLKLVNVAFREVVRESSMSWQCTGVRYSSTSTAVAWNMRRTLRTPDGISDSEIASTCMAWKS